MTRRIPVRHVLVAASLAMALVAPFRAGPADSQERPALEQAREPRSAAPVNGMRQSPPLPAGPVEGMALTPPPPSPPPDRVARRPGALEGQGERPVQAGRLPNQTTGTPRRERVVRDICIGC